MGIPKFFRWFRYGSPQAERLPATIEARLHLRMAQAKRPVVLTARPNAPFTQ